MKLIKTRREVGQITKQQGSDMEPWIVKATRKKKRNNKQQTTNRANNKTSGPTSQ